MSTSSFRPVAATLLVIVLATGAFVLGSATADASQSSTPQSTLVDSPEQSERMEADEHCEWDHHDWNEEEFDDHLEQEIEEFFSEENFEENIEEFFSEENIEEKIEEFFDAFED